MAVSTEQKVGLFFLAALITLGVMIELVEDWRPFEDQRAYLAYFETSVGLREGDPVRMAGVEVGRVSGIGIEDHRVRIDFTVNDQTVIRADSTASIRQTNLLGGVFLGLDFGSPQSETLPAGSAVPTRKSSNFDELITNLDQNQERVLGALGELIQENREQLSDAVDSLNSIMTKIDEGEGTLGQLVNQPELFRELVDFSRRFNSLLSQIESGEGTFGKLLTDPRLYDRLQGTLENVEEISAKLKSGKGTFGRMLEDESLYDDLRITLNGLREITEKINAGQGTMGQLVNDDAFYADLRQAVARLNSIAGKIDSGQGTLGRLINEDALYRDAETTLQKVEKAVDGLSDTGPVSALGVVLGTLF